MRTREKLTKSQQKVFDIINTYSEEGRVPSVRELCQASGFTSTSTIFLHLNSLEKKGYIEREKGHNRLIKIVGKEQNRTIPVVGQIRAGKPILASEEITEYIPAANDISNDSFALIVKGDSMKNVGIYEGDIIVVNPNLSYINSDIVAAILEGDNGEYEATVKRYYKENGFVRLQPENDDYQPIIIEEEKVQILGKIVSLVRKF